MKDAAGYIAVVVWWLCLVTFAVLASGCASSGVELDAEGHDGYCDSICIDVSGYGSMDGEVYGSGDACEQGTGVGVDLSACCPEGYDAVGYCDVSEHVVACAAACDV